MSALTRQQVAWYTITVIKVAESMDDLVKKQMLVLVATRNLAGSHLDLPASLSQLLVDSIKRWQSKVFRTHHTKTITGHNWESFLGSVTLRRQFPTCGGNVRPTPDLNGKLGFFLLQQRQTSSNAPQNSEAIRVKTSIPVRTQRLELYTFASYGDCRRLQCQLGVPHKQGDSEQRMLLFRTDEVVYQHQRTGCFMDIPHQQSTS